MRVKIGKCQGFCGYRRFYLIWSPVIVVVVDDVVVVIDVVVTRFKVGARNKTKRAVKLTGGGGTAAAFAPALLAVRPSAVRGAGTGTHMKRYPYRSRALLTRSSFDCPDPLIFPQCGKIRGVR